VNIEWFEDLLAVIESGSFNRAAERRNITQPAFSRRIRGIEEALGTELFDRSRRPAQLKPFIAEQEETIRTLANGLRELKIAIRSERSHSPILTIASQHAISSTLVPPLLGSLATSERLRVKLRSANRSECTAMLFAGEAELAIVYQLENEHSGPSNDFLQSEIISGDHLIPIVKSDSAIHKSLEKPGSVLPIVGYPRQEFLGTAFARSILPAMDGKFVTDEISETALTSAALQFAAEGIAIAWVPASLAANMLKSGKISKVDGQLPSLALNVVIQRRKGQTGKQASKAWSTILQSPAITALTDQP